MSSGCRDFIYPVSVCVSKVGEDFRRKLGLSAGPKVNLNV